MLNALQTQRVLQDFVNKVVKDSKSTLQSKGKKASGDLINTLRGEVKASENSFEATILAEDYWKYIDKGVSGVKQKYQTPFSYKSKGGKTGLKGMPPPNKLTTWIKQKTGAFLGRDRKQQGFAAAVGVFYYGIEPTHFLTDNFEIAFDSLPDELVKAYALDLENFIEFTLKK